MPRIDRLTAILIQLHTRRVVTAREMAARHGVSLRTIYRDIRTLESAGVPIGAEAGRGYYLAEGYRLPPVMFTPEEAGAFLMGGKLIEKFGDPAVNRHFSAALDKIKAVLNRSDQEYVNRLEALVTVLRATPRAAQALPEDRLITLQTLMAEDQLAAIDYLSGYKAEFSRRTVEPLGLCFYASYWHLLAWCRLRGAYRDFRVDRIRTITPAAGRFDRGRHGSLERLVDEIVMPAELKPAALCFTPKAARLIQDQKYYFGFVRDQSDPQGVHMHFLVAHYDYLAHWLLSLVDQVTIEEPEELRQCVIEHVRRLNRHYQDVGQLGGSAVLNRKINV